jgi:hypothetical protein
LNTAAYPPVDSGAALGLPDRTITVTGDRQEVSWVALNPTNHVRGRLVDGRGAPIGDVRISANGFIADGLAQTGSLVYRRGNNAWASVRTDADGRFDLMLFPGLWKLSAESPFADGPAVGLRDVAVINGLDGADIQLIAQRFTAEITGSVIDTSGRPVEGLHVGASAKMGEQLFTTSGSTDRQGKFRMQAFSGDWRVTAWELYTGYPTLRRNIPTKALSVSGTNAVVEFVVEPVMFTSQLRGRVVDSAGAAVSGLFVHASRSDGALRLDMQTGYSGTFEFGISGGSWFISTDNFQDGNGFYLGQRISIEIEDGLDQTNLFLVAQRASAQITGDVLDTDRGAVAGLPVLASTDLQGTNYVVRGETDQQGRFWIDVIDASWDVQVGDHVLNTLGFQSLAAGTVTVTGLTEKLDFVAQRIVGDGRVLAFGSPTRTAEGAFQLLAASQTAQRYRIEASPNLRDWTAISTNVTQGGSFVITDSQSDNAPLRFYRAVLLE